MKSKDFENAEEMIKKLEEKKQKETALAKDFIRAEFEKIVKNNTISVAEIQRRLKIGYVRAAEFVDLMELTNAIKPPERSRLILDKSQLVEEAVNYFSLEVRDEEKINELNDYDTYVFAVKNEFDAENVDYYWLVRLISENFVKDEEYIKMIDYVFDCNCSKIKDKDKRTKKIFEYYFKFSPVLSIVTLQYFADKLKNETLKNSDKINIDFKEKLEKLRFFGKLTEEK